MPNPGLVDQKELLRWADNLGSKSGLPKLIRKLILETGKGIVELGFAAGEGVSVGGWDGTVRATEATAFVPAGLSLWELSTEKSVGTKADRDYEKRNSTPDGSSTSECTYVAVSLRRFAKRDSWANERTEEGRWKKVRALGVDDIETWLEDAPVTHAWISDLLGFSPHGIRAGDTWWQDWSSETTPWISPELILSGRDKQTQTLLERINGKPLVTTIRAESTEEVQAFVAAIAEKAASDGDPRLLAQLAIVDSPEAWRRLKGHERPIVLIAASDDVISEVTMSPGHHVIVPVRGTPSADIELPPIEETQAEAALKSAGMTNERLANRSARLARKNLRAFRRSLASKPELHTPPWAVPPGSRLIRGVLLAGSWEGRIEGDLRIVSDLVGKSGDELREAIDELAGSQDPMLTRVDQSWSLVSPEDAWIQVGGQLDDEDLTRLRQAVLAVLLEIDPALDLERGDRWRSAIEGKTRIYSGALRKGLATSLALVGIFSERITGGRGQIFVSNLVAEILERANNDRSGNTWQSIADILPLLAEAAPEALAEGVLTGLQGEEPVLRHIFGDAQTDSHFLSPSSPHTGLLWALETLSWSPDHFSQAVDLLARLQEVDPGGQLANRPSNSLVEIFCPWFPEGAATTEERLAVIDVLRSRRPEIAWELMKSMLPSGSSFKSSISEPFYRPWKDDRLSQTSDPEIYDDIAQRLVEDAGTSGERWASLLDGGSTVQWIWKTVIEGLKSAVEAMGPEDGNELWEPLRAFIAKHREFPDADWALPASDLDELDAIEQTIAPDNEAQGSAWLFADHWPDLGTASKSDIDDYRKELASRRLTAVEAISRSGGLVGTLKFALDVEFPGAVGVSLADSSNGEYDDEIVGLLASNVPAEKDFAIGFFSRRFKFEGWTWLEALTDRTADIPSESVGLLLAITDDFPAAWEKAEELGEDVERAFWSVFSPYGLGKDWEHLQLAASKLNAFTRPCTALRLMEIYLTTQDEQSANLAPVMIDSLDAILKTQDSDPEFPGLSQYDFQRAFNYLDQHRDEIGIDRIAQLEWAYLPALGIEPIANALHEQLAESPEFFVEVISAIYRANSDDGEESPSSDEVATAHNAHRLLSSWRRLPGQDGEGFVNFDALEQWVNEALTALEKSDRLEVGEIYIGQILAHAPQDGGGLGPCEAVRDLIEVIENPRIERGLKTQLFNNRGTTSRSPTAGGDQERALAEEYRAAATRFKNRWPRIAKVLRGLADEYDLDAMRMDDEAERRRRGSD